MSLRRATAMILGLFLMAAAPLPAPASAPPQAGAPPATKDANRPVMVLAYLLACMQALTAYNTTAAILVCGNALDLDPRNPDAYKLRGYAYLMEHRFQRAEMDFRSGLALRKDDDGMVAGLGQSLSGQGRFREAVKLLSRATQLEPGKPAYWSALCWARTGDGRALKTALADCGRALALAPGAAAALNGRGLVMLKMRRFPAAIRDYDASLSAVPRQPSARFGRGLARLWTADRRGVADIALARTADAGIDDLFVLLNVLPADCAHPGRLACPPGFPSRPERPGGNYRAMVVSLTSPDADTDTLLSIEAGRLDLMVDQIALLLDRPAPVHAEEAPRTPGQILARLEATAARFNALLPAACYCAHVPARHCAPVRLARTAQTRRAAIQAADALYARVYPVWRAACRGRQDRCRIE